MNFVELPEDFSPAFCDAVYGLAGSQAGELVDVEVADEGGNVLGIKRFDGGGVVNANIAPYLQRMLNPRPLAAGRCRFEADPGRVAVAAVRACVDDGNGDEGGAVGAVAAPQRLFVGASERIETAKLLTSLPERRELAAGEFDELSVAVLDAEVSAKIEIRGTVDFEMVVFGANAEDEIVTLVVDAGHIAREAEARGVAWEDCREAEVRLCVDGEEIARVVYDMVTPEPGSVRLGWVNAKGTVDYHTFAGVVGEEMTVGKERFVSEGGYGAMCRRREVVRTLAAGYCTDSVAGALAGLIAAPRVWRIGPGEVVPLEVMDDSVTLSAYGELSCFTLSVMERKVLACQNFE